jgi:flavin reductase (DIM6/NTAB) family NADH-FMN oxidoreductase RutF
VPVDERTFRLAMSNFASGVTIVTTLHEGVRHGLTVASFASLSLEPPLVLVCLEKRVTTHDAIEASGHFGVSILEETQAELSIQFATRAGDRFEGVSTSEGTLGDPLIEGALVKLECSVVDVLPGGDHTIYVGRVESAEVSDSGEPLVYFGSTYRELKR